jgi:uncharacterized membrane protein
MSKIETLIKELEFKKKKIEFINTILESVKEYEDVEDEVKADILVIMEEFVAKVVDSIENDAGVESDKKSEFSKEEVDALRAVAQRLKNKPVQETASQPPAPKKPQRTPVDNNDKLAFAMENRRLADKKVKVINTENDVSFIGTVVGLDAPFVVVQPKDGPAVKVPLEDVVPL